MNFQIFKLVLEKAEEPEIKLPTSAAAAKSLQSCPTLCDPIDGSPPGSSVLGILQARTLEWVAISFSSAWKWKVKVKSLSRVRLFTTHGLQPTRLLRLWDFPGKSTGVGCHCLLQVYTLPYVKEIASGNLLYDSGNSNWGSTTNYTHSSKGYISVFHGGLEGDVMFLYLCQFLAISVLEFGSTVFSREWLYALRALEKTQGVHFSVVFSSVIGQFERPHVS